MTAGPWLLKGSIAMAVTAAMVVTALRLLRIHSPALHQWGCLVTLLAGYLGAVPLAIIPLPEPFRKSTTTTLLSPGEVVATTGGRAWIRALATGTPPPPSDATAGHQPITMAPRPAPAYGWTILWYSGMALVFLASVAGYARMVCPLRQARPAPPGWVRQWRAVVRRAGAKPVPMLCHRDLGPLVFIRPGGTVLVVPHPLWQQLTTPQRRAVLWHEAAHLRRRDPWLFLAARLLALPFWFHPAAWWARRHLVEAAEWACDQAVRRQCGPNTACALARALLTLLQTTRPLPAAAAVQSGSFKRRVVRLLAGETLKESAMKRILLVLLLLGCAIGSAVRFRVVAGEEEIRQQQQLVDPQRLAEVAQDLARSPDQRTQVAGKLLQTDAGRVVLQDQLRRMAQRWQEEFRRQAIQRFWESHFVLQDGRWQLRPEHQDWGHQFQQAVQQFQEDLEVIRPVLEETARKLAGQSELDQLARRLLAHEAGAFGLYVRELRRRLHPDEQAVLRLLGELVVDDGTGFLVLRASRREEAALVCERIREAERITEALHREFQQLAGELATPDPFHQRLQAALKDPLLAILLAGELVDRHEGATAQELAKFFEQLENMIYDTGKGILVKPEARPELEKVLDQHQHLADTIAHVRPAVARWANRIRAGDPLADQWRQLARSPVFLARIALRLDTAGSDPESTTRALLAQIVQPDDQGNLHLRAENAEELQRAFQDLFREHRQVRRFGLILSPWIEKVQDEPLRQAMEMLPGQFLLVQAIQDFVRQQQPDFLQAWLQEHFTRTENGWTLRPGHEPMIQQLQEAVQAVQRELQKDDF